MSAIVGLSHVATITADLDRYLRFYCDVLELEHLITLEMRHPPFWRHAAVAVAPGCVLHVFEVPGFDPTAEGVVDDEITRRGRLDHFGFLVPDENSLAAVRDRLVAAGASTGDLHPLGPVLTVPFVDPDGFRGEVNCPNPAFDVTADEGEAVQRLSDPDWMRWVEAPVFAPARGVPVG